MTKKIAITVASREGINAPMDEHFGRAPFFLILNDAQTTLAKVVKNDVSTAVHGAGTSAASVMASNGVTDVISVQFGPKAYTALARLKIKMWTASAGLSAKEALNEYFKGNLSLQQMKVY